MQNPYARAPLCVAQVDPVGGAVIQQCFFLGAVPKAVLEAARRPRRTANDVATLRRFYGPHWGRLLSCEPPGSAYSLDAGVRMGYLADEHIGGELDFGDMSELDAELAAEAPVEAPAEAPAAASSAGTIYSDLAVYPEDTIMDLREKLHAATGIAPYRQHLFYYVADEGPLVPYRLTVDGAPIAVDWHEIRAPGSGGRRIAGLPIDMQLEERKAALQVEALDLFTRLQRDGSHLRVTRAYFVDLYRALPPLKAADRPADNLGAVLRDPYQFDLLYYGSLLRYWPLLSPDAALLALSEPERMEAVYPSLAPASADARFRLERGLADLAYKWRATGKSTRAATAVTAATVRVRPEASRMRVAIRNVFDALPTSERLAILQARFEVDSALLIEAGVPLATRQGQAPILATKRHASSYGPRAADLERFVSHPPKRPALSIAHLRGDPLPGAKTVHQYAYLTLLPTGEYETALGWPEDDRVGFDEVSSTVTKLVAPTVKAINALGPLAFPIGGELTDAGTKTASLGEITVSAFWPHTVSGDGFREMKARFRAYERAGLIAVRGLQQAGAFTFSFRKGVVAYSTTGLEGSGYGWLVDPALMSKWTNVYQGRVVRIFHRATDVRVEVIAADSLEEFEMIRRYTFAFLDGLVSGPDPLPAGQAVLSVPESSRTLRRLQERDPNLYNVKKYDPNATVYSVLCQSGRQPQVFNDDEKEALPMKKKAALTKYWNFTGNVPAYYGCLDPRYPWLSFWADQHPLGYCIPCCKKTEPAPLTRAAAVNAKCLARAESEEPDPASLSRHVLSYGKAIPVGRLGELPGELFREAAPLPHGLYLVGVEQSVPAVPTAGFAYSLAFALEDGSGPDGVFTELAAVAREMGDTFYSLGGGRATAFSSASALADTILAAFVARSDSLSEFGPGGAAENGWPHILADLVRYAYGIEIATVADNGGAPTLTLSSDARASLLMPACADMILLVSGPMGTYPAALTNQKLALKIPPESRWMVSRRVFSRASPGDVADRVVETVVSVLTIAADTPAEQFTLAATAAALKLDERLVDFHGRCYGVIARTAGGRVYLPVHYTSVSVDGAPVGYGTRPPAAARAAVIEAARRVCPALDATAAPLIIDAKLVGFVWDGLHFWHAPEDTSASTFIKDAGATAGSAWPLLYDARDIDEAIAARRTGKSAGTFTTGAASTDIMNDAADLAHAAQRRNRLYRLFVSEFSDLLRHDRNAPLRSELYAAIRRTRFGQPASVTALRRALSALLADHPDDIQAVRDAVARAYVAHASPAVHAIQYLEATTFSFDRLTLARLRALPHEAIVAELQTLMKGRVTTAAAAAPAPASAPASANMYAAGREKLAVPAARLADYYDMLAADVRNPGKAGLLAAVASGVFDPLDFTQRPGEHLRLNVGE